MKIRTFERIDFNRVQAIYLQGIETNNATFQLEKKSWEQWCSSMIESTVLVLEDANSEVVAWAGLSAVSSRTVYKGVAEVSIYVAQEGAGKGIGSMLMEALIKDSETQGFWTLQAAIFPENIGSIKLHAKYGFSLIGRRKALGKLHGFWRDVDLMERRSTLVGLT